MIVSRRNCHDTGLLSYADSVDSRKTLNVCGCDILGHKLPQGATVKTHVENIIVLDSIRNLLVTLQCTEVVIEMLKY